MRRTKIVCTLGPATDNKEIMREMMLAGMDVARLNFSHGSHPEQLGRLNMLKAVREEMNLPVAALMDTKGPEIRLGKFENGEIFLEGGQSFTLTAKDILGNQSIASVSYKDLFKDVRIGSRILIDDGQIEMTVTELRGHDIVCSVINKGRVSDHKGLNVPGVVLSLPYLSPADKADILFAAEHQFDFIAASFVRTADDVLDIRRFLDENGGTEIKIISKIENRQGVDNIEEILAVSNGIMIARGDMGVELDFTEIPIIQKDLIQRCYNSGRPAITATQMLDSMMQSPRPTRAEITDVANAIYDGTSAIMLSGETAAGKYPVESVKTMAAIALRTEQDIAYQRLFKVRMGEETRLSVTAAVAHATCTTAMDTGANAIISVTKSGETARFLCKYRPSTPIIACVMDERVCRQLNLSWGIKPITMPYAKDTDEMIDLAVKTAQENSLVANGDLVIITAGVPVGVSGTTNMLKAHLVGDSAVSGVGIGSVNTTGRVYICHSNSSGRGFQSGDILVCARTDNSMLDMMKNAAAIITEDGGMNSHAAIVGMALEKPVIIGATGASMKLDNGRLITVDAEHGIVHLMNE